MLRFWITKYLDRHPLQKKIASWWIKNGLPLPEKIKRQIANQIHAEIIVRLMDIVVKKGSVSLEEAFKVNYAIGREIAEQTKDILQVDPNSAMDLARIIDFLHSLHDIKGKRIITINNKETISYWHSCPLSNRLAELQDGGGPYYCFLYQEMYKGVLHGINPKASTNNLTITKALGHPYCKLRTRVDV